ncbi:MAG: S1 family peptidase [Deltaproteobacteria bacterium]|nr:S1 family peptidase [Deltaproteobacteria bacterium]
MARSSTRAILVGLGLVVGCGDQGLNVADWTHASVSAPAAPSTEPVDAGRSVPRAAAGFLEIEGSPILPWCAAVLVAPDVVVTAASCLEAAPLWELRFGVGSTEDLADGVGSFEVTEILEHPHVDQPQHALVALQLAEPVPNVEPATLGGVATLGCGFEAISYRFHLRGDRGARTRWFGCLDRAVDGLRLNAEHGAGDCHGDDGAGVFDSARDELVGLVVGDTSRGPCTTQLQIASVADNADFFETALDLSAPPA